MTERRACYDPAPDPLLSQEAAKIQVFLVGLGVGRAFALTQHHLGRRSQLI